jgi:hypothetical protein
MHSNGYLDGRSLSVGRPVMGMDTDGPRQPRIAIISLHTSPRDQPGTGDSGGMNVYILEVADRLAQQGVVVDITRHRVGPDVEHLLPGRGCSRAGCAGVPKEDPPSVFRSFLTASCRWPSATPPAARWPRARTTRCTATTASGWVGERAKRLEGAPASFHTLGRRTSRSRWTTARRARGCTARSR